MTLHLSVDVLRWLQFLLKSLRSAVLTAKDLTFTWSFTWALIQLCFPLPACGFMPCHLRKWLGIFFVCCSSDLVLPFFVTSSLGHFWLPANVSEVLLKWPASFYASSEHSLAQTQVTEYIRSTSSSAFPGVGVCELGMLSRMYQQGASPNEASNLSSTTYCTSLINRRCSLLGADARGFWAVISNGLWSVHRITLLPLTHWWLSFIPKTWVSSSISICEWFCSALKRHWLHIYVTGWPCCASAKPIPFSEASSPSVGEFGLKMFGTGAVDTAFLILSKAS